jgi:hypothetical protein
LPLGRRYRRHQAQERERQKKCPEHKAPLVDDDYAASFFASP